MSSRSASSNSSDAKWLKSGASSVANLLDDSDLQDLLMIGENDSYASYDGDGNNCNRQLNTLISPNFKSDNLSMPSLSTNESNKKSADTSEESKNSKLDNDDQKAHKYQKLLQNDFGESAGAATASTYQLEYSEGQNKPQKDNKITRLNKSKSAKRAKKPAVPRQSSKSKAAQIKQPSHDISSAQYLNKNALDCFDKLNQFMDNDIDSSADPLQNGDLWDTSLEYENQRQDDADEDDNGSINGDAASTIDEETIDLLSNDYSAYSTSQNKIKVKNRQHAKNTRMRKKSYIESLRSSIAVMAEECEAVRQRRIADVQDVVESVALRKDILINFLNLRLIGELRQDLWRELLDEKITMVLPITPYRSFSPLEIVDCQRHIHGIASVIADVASFSFMLQSIGTRREDRSMIRASFACDSDDIALVDNTAITKFTFSTENAMEFGSRCELFVQGMITAKFSNENKLTYFEMIFDVMNVMQLLRRAMVPSNNHIRFKLIPQGGSSVYTSSSNSLSADFHVVPNTMRIIREKSSEVRVVVDVSAPHRIIFCNDIFMEVFAHFDQAKIIQKSIFALIHPRHTEGKLHLESALRAIRDRIPGVAIVNIIAPASMAQTSSSSQTSSTNLGTAESQSMIRCYCKVLPLYDEGLVKQALVVLECLSLPYLPGTKPVLLLNACRSIYSSSGSSSSGNSGNSNPRGITTTSTKTPNPPDSDRLNSSGKHLMDDDQPSSDAPDSNSYLNVPRFKRQPNSLTSNLKIIDNSVVDVDPTRLVTRYPKLI